MTSRLQKLAVSDFDLAQTLDSGQVFHWIQQGPGYLGTIGEAAVYIEQEGGELRFAGASPEEIVHYFSLDEPLAEIVATFPRDPAMIAAANFCRGMRIIRQPVWECLAAFITSSMKQVLHIRQMSLAIRLRWGNRVATLGYEHRTYPSAAILSQASEEELWACKLGFRAKNLLATARAVAGGAIDLSASSALSDEALRELLCTLPGVGEKIANCVMLFGYNRPKSFPIDVWIERILREIYFPKRRKVTAKELREFSRSYFGPYSGYAQQHLFHHARKTWSRGKSRQAVNGVK